MNLHEFIYTLFIKWQISDIWHEINMENVMTFYVKNIFHYKFVFILHKLINILMKDGAVLTLLLTVQSVIQWWY